MADFKGASHREIAYQQLAYGVITKAQFDILARRFGFDEQSQTTPAPQPVLLPDDMFATISASGPPPEPPKPADPFAVNPSTITTDQLAAMFGALLGPTK